jgi:hypothetical protein
MAKGNDFLSHRQVFGVESRVMAACSKSWPNVILVSRLYGVAEDLG